MAVLCIICLNQPLNWYHRDSPSQKTAVDCNIIRHGLIIAAHIELCANTGA